MKHRKKTFLGIIFIISLVATLGSLYVGYRGDPFVNAQTGYRFSRLNAIPPCDICRYIRVAQYPILLISGIGLLTQDKHSFKYIWPLALVGLVLSVYKVGLEQGMIPESKICTSGISCADPTILGNIISLPVAGALAFIAILLLCFLSLSNKHGN